VEFEERSPRHLKPIQAIPPNLVFARCDGGPIKEGRCEMGESAREYRSPLRQDGGAGRDAAADGGVDGSHGTSTGIVVSGAIEAVTTLDGY
jgi:hypothetical protein